MHIFQQRRIQGGRAIDAFTPLPGISSAMSPNTRKRGGVKGESNRVEVETGNFFTYLIDMELH